MASQPDHCHPESPPKSIPAAPSISPLTFGKVLDALPRISNCKTPDINDKIAKRWGLKPVENSDAFKAKYREGREALFFPM